MRGYDYNRRKAAKIVDIYQRIKAAKPHKGFAKPRCILQIIRDTGNEDFEPYNGSDKAIQHLAVGLMQISSIDVVLVLDGKANIADVRADEIWAEYRRDDTGKGDQMRVA